MLTLSVVAFSSCTSTQHQLPNNPIDHPVILPDGMARHNFELPRNGNFSDQLLLFAVPSYGLSKSWEMPLVVFPYFRTLLGENNYYENGSISKDRRYHVIGFGVTKYGFQTVDEKAFYDLGVEYEVHEFLSENVRTMYGASIHNRSNGDVRGFGLELEIGYRLTTNWQLSASINSKFERQRHWLNRNIDEYEVRNSPFSENLANLSVERTWQSGWGLGCGANLRSYIEGVTRGKEVQWDRINDESADFRVSFYW